MSAALQRARAYWASRSPREQRFLQGWAVAMLGLGLYFGLLSPLWQQISRLQVQVPRLEAQLMAMRATQPALAAPGKAATADLRSAAFSAMSARQLSADIRPLAAGQVEISLTQPNATAAVLLASALRSELAAQVVSLQLKQQGSEIGLVLVLARAGRSE
ncbi:type II secretion system protein GspM [Chitinibacter sp. ZOR0017]|uniref:type II secretion system protein GspM n=1 Tax=Chitinibacter sp. ZOR0017 TaxID=1339254 RepID=UPI0006457E3C|nr:type II secretion system protein GspM [Chitinibacter sp. ZOR0017]